MRTLPTLLITLAVCFAAVLPFVNAQDTTSTPGSPATSAPTNAPTDAPTSAPTNAPTSASPSAPTSAPTNAPTSASTDAPTSTPTSTPSNSTVPPAEADAYQQLSKLPDHINYLVGSTTALDARASDQLNTIFTSPVVQLFLGAAASQPFTDIQKVQVLNTLWIVKFAYDVDRRIPTLKTTYYISLARLESIYLRQSSRFLSTVATIDADTAAALNLTSRVNISTSPLLQNLNLQYKSYLFSLGLDIYIGQVLAQLIGDSTLARQLPAGVMGAVRAGVAGFQSVSYVANQVTDLSMTDLLLSPDAVSIVQQPQVFYFHLKKR